MFLRRRLLLKIRLQQPSHALQTRRIHLVHGVVDGAAVWIVGTGDVGGRNAALAESEQAIVCRGARFRHKPGFVAPFLAKRNDDLAQRRVGIAVDNKALFGSADEVEQNHCLRQRVTRQALG